MAPGVKAKRKLQFAKETTNGTAVTTATAIWRGEVEGLSDDREVVVVPEHVGIYGGTNRTNIPKITAACEIPETPATFEQLPYILAMSFGGPVTGTADGSGSSGYKYVTTIPTTSAPTNTSYTIQAGDDYEGEYMAYGKCTQFTLKGSQGTAITVAGSTIGRQVVRMGSGLTSGISIPSTEDILFGKSKLYLDAVGGTIGTTQITNQFLGFEIPFEAMWIPKFTGDGELYWTFVVYVDHKITGKLTMEHDAAVNGDTGIKSLLRAQTKRLMRIQTTGSAYGTAGSGTLFSGVKGLRIDLPIIFTKVPPLEDIDGNDTVTVEFESKYDATYAGSGSISVANEVSALP